MENKPRNIKVTFYYYSDLLKKGYTNIEYYNEYQDYKLFAMAMNWQIVKVEKI
jgi:hypothetical protein